MNEKWEAVPSHLAEPQPNGKHLQTVTLCGDLGIRGLEDRCRWGSGGWGAECCVLGAGASKLALHERDSPTPSCGPTLSVCIPEELAFSDV